MVGCFIMLHHGFKSNFFPNNQDLNWLKNLLVASYCKEHISIQECKQLLDIVSEFNFEPKEQTYASLVSFVLTQTFVVISTFICSETLKKLYAFENFLFEQFGGSYYLAQERLQAINDMEGEAVGTIYCSMVILQSGKETSVFLCLGHVSPGAWLFGELDCLPKVSS